MDVIPFETNNYAYFLNNIVMIPEKECGLNGFYKIVSCSEKFFFAKKMNYETKLVKTIVDANCQTETKTYEAIISSEFDNDIIKKIKKTSVNKKYPVVICSVVRYEV